MIVEDKTALRNRMREARSQIKVEARIAAARSVAADGLAFADLPEGAVISGYYPVRQEFDVLPLMARLSREGFRIALPIIGASRVLSFSAWRVDAPMRPGPFGIPAPAEHKPAEPDALLVPLLAFDARGFRLGYGAGYYDNTLTALRAKRPVIAIGVAFNEQELPEVPTEPHDARLDWLLTPGGARRCGAG